MKLYAELNPETGDLQIITRANGKPINFPFKRMEGESKFIKGIRRILWNLTLRLSGLYTNEELHGRDKDPVRGEECARVSEAFEQKRRRCNDQGTPIGNGIVVATDMDIGSVNDWAIQRWLRTSLNTVLSWMEGEVPKYQRPAYFNQQNLEPKHLDLNIIYTSKNSFQHKNAAILVILEGDYGITAVKSTMGHFGKWKKLGLKMRQVLEENSKNISSGVQQALTQTIGTFESTQPDLSINEKQPLLSAYSLGSVPKQSEEAGALSSPDPEFRQRRRVNEL